MSSLDIKIRYSMYRRHCFWYFCDFMRFSRSLMNSERGTSLGLAGVFPMDLLDLSSSLRSLKSKLILQSKSETIMV